VNKWFIDNKIDAYMIVYMDDSLIIHGKEVLSKLVYKSVKDVYQKRLNLASNDSKYQTTE